MVSMDVVPVPFPTEEFKSCLYNSFRSVGWIANHWISRGLGVYVEPQPFRPSYDVQPLYADRGWDLVLRTIPGNDYLVQVKSSKDGRFIDFDRYPHESILLDSRYRMDKAKRKVDLYVVVNPYLTDAIIIPRVSSEDEWFDMDFWDKRYRRYVTKVMVPMRCAAPFFAYTDAALCD